MLRKVSIILCLFIFSSCASPEPSPEPSTSPVSRLNDDAVYQEAKKLDYEMAVSLYVYVFLQKRNLEKELSQLGTNNPRAIAISNMLKTVTQQCDEIEIALAKN